MTLQEAMKGLEAGRLPESSGQVGREILWMNRRYSLQPASVISYDRDAWFSEREPGVRITFDRNLSFRNWALDLNSRDPGIFLLPGNLRLMEIKTGGHLPLWLASLLQEADVRRTHFSKYGLAYQLYIQPESGRKERNNKKCSTVSLLMGA